MTRRSLSPRSLCRRATSFSAAPVLKLADHGLYRLSVWASSRWLAAVGILLAVAVGGAVFVGPILGGGWEAVSVFETCFGVLLAIAIFTWTLAGYASHEADRKHHGAQQFAELVKRRTFGPAPLADWHRRLLATVLRVEQAQVEGELLLYLVEQHDSQGGKEAILITQRHWFIRLVSRGAGGTQAIDLSTGRRLN